mmetsp:Transcript_75953/g.210902  ORF Transcript_75953/g.210902 Transcript_75953/m.210902 type:complete len:272 (-) Transcript_75953:103-918(-)
MAKRPAELEMVTMRGDGEARNNGIMALMTPSVPKKFVSIVILACFSNGVNSHFPYKVGSLKQIAALFTKISSAPNSLTMKSRANRMLAESRSSRCVHATSPPAAWSSRTTADADSMFWQPRTVLTPALTNFRAISFPIPVLPPVTNATLRIDVSPKLIGCGAAISGRCAVTGCIAVIAGCDGTSVGCGGPGIIGNATTSLGNGAAIMGCGVTITCCAVPAVIGLEPSATGTTIIRCGTPAIIGLGVREVVGCCPIQCMGIPAGIIACRGAA